MSGVFITGTDTDVGKTVVCSWLMAHSNAQYWKPIQSGLLEETDLAKVKRPVSYTHLTLPTKA